MSLAARILAGDRGALARVITMVESSRADHRVMGSSVLSEILRSSAGREGIERSFRVGITGPPGAGKSTLIEALGASYLRDGSRLRVGPRDHGDERDRKLAVLAVDPSSDRTGGSILGDKTRMPELARDERAFVRPSPSRGTLGGVTRSTQEAMPLCEAAGFDFSLIETVGVGQSETAVERMVDMFVLVVPPTAGDELQGVKKGVVELADLVIVNKADGDLIPSANRTVTDYSSALRLTSPKSSFWRPKVVSCSALSGNGVPELLDAFARYQDAIDQEVSPGTTVKVMRRADQRVRWLRTMLRDRSFDLLVQNESFSHDLREWEAKIRRGDAAAGEACDSLLRQVSIGT